MVEAEDCVFLKVGKVVLNSAFDFLATFVYVAPEHSVVYENDNLNGIEVLDNYMTEITRQYPVLPWFLCGDFNARTFGLSDIDTVDESRHAEPLQVLEELLVDMPHSARKSKDKSKNAYGRRLIEFCREYCVYIVNGRTPSDSNGEITRVANHGKSIVDYCICSKPVFDLVTDTCVADRSESDHFPIVTSFCCEINDVGEEEGAILLEEGVEFTWKEQYAESFAGFINENFDSCFHNFLTALEADNEEGLDVFISFVQNAADKMRVQSGPGGRRHKIHARNHCGGIKNVRWQRKRNTLG